MLQDLFTNITTVVSFLFIVGQVFNRYALEKDSPLKIRMVIGGIFGFMGIILMLFTIRATDIVIVDLRSIAVICAGIFGGPVAVIIASLATGIFRIAYFGVNAASIVAFIASLIIGLGCTYISKSNYTSLKKFILMFVVAMVTSNIALGYLLFDSPNFLEIIKYYWLIYIFGAILAYYACEYIILNGTTYKAMSYYQIMADNLLDMITTHRIEGTYRYASPSSEQLLGIKPEEIIGKDPFQLIHPEDSPKIIEIQTGLRNNTFSEYTQDLRLLNGNGDYIWTESTFKSIKDSEGNVKEIICATRDISERKRIEKKLREQREEAIEANRLKSQFLANMSHELRTPLNSIIGFTTRVIKKSKDSLPSMQLENLEIVKEEGQHLLTLINDLLDYSKLEAGKMDVTIESFDIETVVNEAFSMTKGIMEEKNLQFEKVLLHPNKLEIKSDRIKVKQILINLLSNAFKYSEEGTIKLIAAKEESYFRIEVVDEGIGIDKEHLAQIFNEFHQVDGSYTRKVGGTGLGLAITKRFVEMLGGKIEVESTTGLGSCFIIYLPIDYNNRREIIDFIENHEFNIDGDNRVAFIEDDFGTRRLYSQYLTDEGFTPVSIDENKDIVEEIVKSKPIAIILDIILRNRDGWDILNQLKENPRTKHIPVIMSSVLNEQKIAYRLHADEYLVKPVMQEDLISAINKTVNNSNKIQILIADDDKNYLNLVGQYLNEANISFITASNGKEAIEMLGKYNPELVLLDLMMPVLTGFEVLDWICQSDEYKNTAVIVVSSKSLTNEEKQDLAHRANKVIQKSGTQIENVIKDIIIENRWKKNG